jgi:hypothetical protein
MNTENLKKVYVSKFRVEMCGIRMFSVYVNKQRVTNFRVNLLSFVESGIE